MPTPSRTRLVDVSHTGFGRGVVRIPGPAAQRRLAAVDEQPHKPAPLTEDDYAYAAAVERESLEARRSDRG